MFTVNVTIITTAILIAIQMVSFVLAIYFIFSKKTGMSSEKAQGVEFLISFLLATIILLCKYDVIKFVV